MRFQDSDFEERYNTMWNKIAVSADAQIRQLFGAKGFFSEQQPNYYQLLVNYAQAAKNIVDNLNRQSPMFDDKEYVEGYMIALLSNRYIKIFLNINRELQGVMESTQAVLN